MGPSVSGSIMYKLKSVKTRIWYAAHENMSLGLWREGCMPLPTSPERYRDPTSLIKRNEGLAVSGRREGLQDLKRPWRGGEEEAELCWGQWMSWWTKVKYVRMPKADVLPTSEVKMELSLVSPLFHGVTIVLFQYWGKSTSSLHRSRRHRRRNSSRRRRRHRHHRHRQNN